jgi:ATP-dependent Clp protease adaptor protein ClpS
MSDTQTISTVDTGLSIKLPKKYSVILLNDDYTPIDFVIAVLIEIFGKDSDTAEKITLQVHNEGEGVAGIYYYELAEQKVYETKMFARNNGFPLDMKIEEA